MQRDVYSAIADPTRRRLISLLAKEELNVNDISKHFEMSRTAVSKHMRVLDECGLLHIEKRGRERFCQARLEKLAEVALWVNQYRMFWNDNLDRLEDLLQRQSKNSKSEKPPHHE